MRKIQFEAARQHRREEHLSLIATILPSLVMIALATSSLIYLEIPAVRLPAVVHDGSFPFYIYIYIGTLALLLLLADHLIRKALRGKKGKLR